MVDFRAIYEAIVADPRYQPNIDWGQPRQGHPEGTIRAHIAELERNLERLEAKLSDSEYWKLKVLVHTHDTFKRDAQPGVPIAHPQSHASLARDFLAEFCDDSDLLAMVQYHDEPHALWRQVAAQGSYNHQRFDALLQNIGDWNLFLAFNIVDGCTEGKTRESLRWLFAVVAGKVDSRFSADDVL